jgi:hypothetical protein
MRSRAAMASSLGRSAASTLRSMPKSTACGMSSLPGRPAVPPLLRARETLNPKPLLRARETLNPKPLLRAHESASEGKASRRATGAVRLRGF